jgi:hypothetical protein
MLWPSYSTSRVTAPVARLILRGRPENYQPCEDTDEPGGKGTPSFSLILLEGSTKLL